VCLRPLFNVRKAEACSGDSEGLGALMRVSSDSCVNLFQNGTCVCIMATTSVQCHVQETRASQIDNKLKVGLKRHLFMIAPSLHAVVEACYFRQSHRTYDNVSLGHLCPFCVCIASPGSGIMLIGCMLLHRAGIIKVPWLTRSLWHFI